MGTSHIWSTVHPNDGEGVMSYERAVTKNLQGMFRGFIQNYTVSSDYSYLIIIICLYTVLWYQVFQLNTNNLHTIIYYMCKQPISIEGKVFTNGLGDQGSIPGQAIPKTQINGTWCLLNTQHYNVWIKSKWSNPEKGVVPYPIFQCRSYWKGAFGHPRKG